MDKKSQTDERRANGLKGYYTRRAQIERLRQAADRAEREYFARPIQGRLLALPTDVHLAEIDWSPVTTVETAPAPHRGHIASDRQRGVGKRQQATDAAHRQAQHSSSGRRSAASGQQEATCQCSSLVATAQGIEAPRPEGEVILPCPASKKPRASFFVCIPSTRRNTNLTEPNTGRKKPE